MLKHDDGVRLNPFLLVFFGIRSGIIFYRRLIIMAHTITYVDRTRASPSYISSEPRSDELVRNVQ